MVEPNATVASRRERIALILLILCACALRVYHLDHFSFWLDEALTPLRSGYSLRDILRGVIVIQGFESNDTHPPLYYLTIHATRQLFGTSDFAFRYPSVLFSVLLVPLTWKFGRNLFTSQTGLIAAAIMAVNPQQIWYAQEARMYPQLVFLVSIASYILWQAWCNSQRSPWKSLLLYGLFAGLAAYTHYTALFVVLAQGLIWLVLLWRAGQQKLIAAGVVLGALVAAPFTPFIIRRLLGPAETKYELLSPAVVLADIVRGFGFGLTVRYSDLLIRVLLALMTVIFFVGIWRAPSGQRNFLLLLLLSAPVGLIAGSYLFKPIYAGTRHIMAGSVAFILFLALGIGRMPLPRVGPPLALLAIMLAQGVSLTNLYHNIDYAKDDWRSLIAAIELRAGEDDLVMYHNALLMPLHQHYQQRDDLPFEAYPVYPFMVDDPAAPQMLDHIEQVKRVWFVLDPPFDGRDNEGQVRQALKGAATPLQTLSFHGPNANVGVTSYLVNEPLDQLPAHARRLEDVGPTGIVVSAVEWQSVWVDLFWERGGATRDVTVQLRDLSGGVWSTVDSRVFSAETDPIIRSTHGLLLPVGMPPATYQLWLNDGGWRQIDSVVIDTPIIPSTQPANTIAEFDNGVSLVAVSFADDATFPGNPLPATLLWRFDDVGSAMASQYELAVFGDAGELRRDTEPLIADWINAEQLEAGAVFAQQIGIYPRPDTAAGRYELEWQLLEGDVAQGGAMRGGTFRVLAWPLVSELPAVDNLVDSGDNRFNDGIVLRGFTQSAETLRAGEALDVQLYWQSNVAQVRNWQVFVHVVNSAESPPSAQANGTPSGGLRPISGWRANEIITDRYQVALPADMVAGTYEIYVGFFDGAERMPVTANDTAQPFNQLFLTTVTVE